MRKPAPVLLGFFLTIALLGAREIFADTDSPPRNSFIVHAQILLAPGGDANHNSQIDAGDTVVFSYEITNQTAGEFSSVFLKTNIPRARLNFIRDVRGTPSLSDRGGMVEIPNLHFGPNQTLTVSFQARINYFQGDGLTLSTQPELTAKNGSALAKSMKIEIMIHALVDRGNPTNITSKKR